MKIYSISTRVTPFIKSFPKMYPFLKRSATLFFFLLVLVLTAFTQSKKVTGKVIDETTGEPLPGVSVTIEGSDNATTAGNSGSFTIEVPSSKTTLLFTHVGYEIQKIRVGNQSFIGVSLVAENKELDKVIVVGYGTQKKSDLTGSVSVVSGRDFDKAPVVDAVQALQGKVPGLQIISNSGAPGDSKDISIRGLQSLGASTTPLYVIDGTISGDITNISPDDIESITVLKDAASAAIYGARSANGVIIITTKRGTKDQAPVVSFNTYQGIETESNLKLKLLNAAQYVQLDMESYTNAGQLNISPYWDLVTNQPSDIVEKEYSGINTNWPKVIGQNGAIQNYDLSVNSGNDKNSYYTSVSYLTQTGRTVLTGADRMSIRLNSTHKITNFIEFGNNLNVYSSGSYGRPDAYQLAEEQSPLTRPYESDGSYGYVREPAVEGRQVPPQIIAREYKNDNRTYGLLGNIYLKINILKGLTFTPRLSLDYSDNINKSFTPVVQLRNVEGNAQNTVSRYNSFDKHWTADYLLNYDRTFGKAHNVSALLGYSQEEDVFEDLQGSRFGTPNDNIQYLNAGDPSTATNAGGYSDWAFISYIGRLNYNYDGKYYVQVSARDDGSSRFLGKNRWGLFPSYALGWKISREKFFQGFTGVINNLKLRASLGTLGNANVGNYPAYATLSPLTYTLNGELVPSYTLAQFANKDIKWETTKKDNFGIDADFLQSKLNITADYYISHTTNLLFSEPLPLSAGANVGYTSYNPTINGGEIQNKGFEFTAGYHESKKDFSYSVSANFAANRNKLISTNGQNFGIASGLQVGHPLYGFTGYKALGIIKNNDILTKFPQKPNSVLGDIWVQDINGYDANGNLTGKPDGIIDGADRTFIGKRYPDFTYGMVGSITYKRLSLQVALMGVQGVDLSTDQSSTLTYFQYPTNNITRVLDRWDATANPNGTLPRITKQDNADNVIDMSSMWLSDASFLRINNLNINYSFPEFIYRKLSMKRLDVYIGAENLYTFTKYPEGEVDVTDGGQFNRPLSKVPQPRTYMIGIKTSF